MKRELRAIQQALVNRDKAQTRYIQALNQARAAGCTLEELGQAAGLTRQTIWYTLKKETP